MHSKLPVIMFIHIVICIAILITFMHNNIYAYMHKYFNRLSTFIMQWDTKKFYTWHYDWLPSYLFHCMQTDKCGFTACVHVNHLFCLLKTPYMSAVTLSFEVLARSPNFKVAMYSFMQNYNTAIVHFFESLLCVAFSTQCIWMLSQ